MLLLLFLFGGCEQGAVVRNVQIFADEDQH